MLVAVGLVLFRVLIVAVEVVKVLPFQEVKTKVLEVVKVVRLEVVVEEAVVVDAVV